MTSNEHVTSEVKKHDDEVAEPQLGPCICTIKSTLVVVVVVAAAVGMRVIVVVIVIFLI